VKAGDLLRKKGDYDLGEVGIALKIFANDNGHPFVTVLAGNGKIKTWYLPKVEVIA